jgi:hypothetical protein
MERDEAAVEAEIKEKGLTAPRITPADIDAQIAAASYHVFEGTTTTVCCLLLRNGFTVVGESACADPRNFNEELGRKTAYDNARNKIWALEGYRLRDRLHYVATAQ